mgnify:CR=1 FL=1
MTREELEKLKNVDIKTVKKEDLVDISTVKINTDLPVKERVEDFIRQIKNPYCYLDHGVVVKVNFTGNKSLVDCLNFSTRFDCIPNV